MGKAGLTIVLTVVSRKIRGNKTMEVVVEDGYVKVIRTRDRECICAGVVIGQGRVADIEFTDPAHQRSNRTRQAAMRALSKAGWK